jgi:hypothetical protein
MIVRMRAHVFLAGGCGLPLGIENTMTSSPRNRQVTKDCWYRLLGRMDAPFGARIKA